MNKAAVNMLICVFGTICMHFSWMHTSECNCWVIGYLHDQGGKNRG